MADNTNLLQLLQKIAIEQKIEHPDIHMKAITTGGANFTSNLYQATITDKTNNKSLKLFAKIAAMNETLRDTAKFQLYDVEQIAYTNIFQTYRKLEEKHGVPEEHKLVLPEYYGSDKIHLQETIVLEDLGSRGFGLYSRFKSVDWPYASTAITELARFHALSFAYQHEKPAEFNNLVKGLVGITFPNSEECKASFDHFVQLAMNAVHEKNKGKLKKFLDSKDLLTTLNDQFQALRHTVLVHADFRPSNMLYRKEDDDNTEVIPVDYQTIRGGCPVSDLVYFIACGTDGPFRAKYYQALIEHYYTELSAALARLKLQVEKTYPREDFEFELKQKLHYGLLVSLIVLPFLTMPEDQSPKAEEISLSYVVQTGDLYSTRLNELINDYVAWGILVD